MTMTSENSFADGKTGRGQPVIRTIGVEDLREVLTKGFEDFKAKPSHLILLIIIYPIVGLFAARLAAGYDILPLIFPLLAGFALIGPVAAIGLYELSRRREQGLDLSFLHTLDPVRSPSIGAIAILSITMMVIYFVWLGASQVIYGLFFDNLVPESIGQFARLVFTTPSGWGMIFVGTGVGFLFAVAVLAIAAISFPMLVDRDVGVMTAVRTSVRAVVANPKTMAIWGIIVVNVLVIGALPLFVGLAVAMPVLGHATWHLYRKLVESDVG
jgi:uncharacterized membrane protein